MARCEKDASIAIPAIQEWWRYNEDDVTKSYESAENDGSE
jgi:hypothetical protein